MNGPTNDSGSYNAISSSTAITTNDSTLLGIFVSAASNTPTINVLDGGSTGATLVAQFTPAGATYYKMPFKAKNGIYVTIGGTVTCTVAWVDG